LKDFAVIAPESTKYKSFDGLESKAALLRPAGYDGKTKLPLVVVYMAGQPAGGETALIPGANCWQRAAMRCFIPICAAQPGTARNSPK